jgi:hypothetical protein
MRCLEFIPFFSFKFFTKGRNEKGVFGLFHSWIGMVDSVQIAIAALRMLMF